MFELFMPKQFQEENRFQYLAMLTCLIGFIVGILYIIGSIIYDYFREIHPETSILILFAILSLFALIIFPLMIISLFKDSKKPKGFLIVSSIILFITFAQVISSFSFSDRLYLPVIIIGTIAYCTSLVCFIFYIHIINYRKNKNRTIEIQNIKKYTILKILTYLWSVVVAILFYLFYLFSLRVIGINETTELLFFVYTPIYCLINISLPFYMFSKYGNKFLKWEIINSIMPIIVFIILGMMAMALSS